MWALSRTLERLVIFAIRSWNRNQLESHREHCLTLGCKCDVIETSRGWKEDLLPAGMFYFRLSYDETRYAIREYLDRWDREHGEIHVRSESGSA